MVERQWEKLLGMKMSSKSKRRGPILTEPRCVCVGKRVFRMPPVHTGMLAFESLAQRRQVVDQVVGSLSLLWETNTGFLPFDWASASCYRRPGEESADGSSLSAYLPILLSKWLYLSNKGHAITNKIFIMWKNTGSYLWERRSQIYLARAWDGHNQYVFQDLHVGIKVLDRNFWVSWHFLGSAKIWQGLGIWNLLHK